MRRLVLLVLLFGMTAVPAVQSPAGAAVAGTVYQVCGPVPDGYARCLADAAATGNAPIGMSPAAMKAAYHWPTSLSLGTGQTVAIVSAFDAPTIEADLGVFDQQYGLPACTTANGCFTKINQGGVGNPSWSFETHIDVEWVHAIAPGARIVLVEAKTNAFIDLLAGADAARNLATYVSGSWGSPEASVETVLDHHFYDVPGVSWFFATGDTGAVQPYYPAASPYVVAVGGTTLRPVNSVYFETGWSGGGGGCSPFEPASSAQAALSTYPAAGCNGKRAMPDLAADADPATGASVYNSDPDENNLVGWFKVGGTSLSAPMIAARAAGLGVVVDQARVYSNPSLVLTPGGGYGAAMVFQDTVLGNNGHPAGPGFDLVTGRGSWIL